MKRWLKISLIIFILAALAGSVFLLKEIYMKILKPTSAKTQIDDTRKQNINTQNIASLPEKNEKPVKFLFLGDLMFDRHIRDTSAKKGNDFIFEKVKNLLADDDLAIANLEGPITGSNSLSIGTLPGEKHHLIFTFEKSLAKTLFESNIKLVNIGNNHILNFGQDGLAETKANLSSANINYFGDNITYIANVNNYKVGFVNYNQFASGSRERTLENIGNLKKQADLVIVYTHWGTEYKPDAADNIKNLGHSFIDSGADLVIGSHPHVIEPVENYNGHRIYYSLGNFIFDQYFSPETKKGLAIEVTITPDKKMEYKDIPLILDNNGQTRVNEL
jgi:poly-gamma-glutamate capsule biosynthesis protein CapA/YwtB (metallophosphatase superfamily)